MLLERLKLWLDNLVAPARAQAIIDAFVALRTQNGSVVEDALQRILLSIQNMEEGNALIYLENDVLDYLANAIQLYGVEINAEVTDTTHIALLTNILVGLQQAEFYEDFAPIYSVFDNALDNTSSIASVLEIITGTESSEIAFHIKKTSNALIDALYRIYKGKMDAFNEKVEQEDEAETLLLREKNRAAREALQGYLLKLSNGDEASLKALQTILGRFATYAPEELFNKCFGFIQSKPNLNLRQQANLWCMVFYLLNYHDASRGLTTLDRRKELKEYISSVYEDMNFVFALSVRVDEVLNG